MTTTAPLQGRLHRVGAAGTQAAGPGVVQILAKSGRTQTESAGSRRQHFFHNPDGWTLECGSDAIRNAYGGSGNFPCTLSLPITAHVTGRNALQVDRIQALLGEKLGQGYRALDVITGVRAFSKKRGEIKFGSCAGLIVTATAEEEGTYGEEEPGLLYTPCLFFPNGYALSIDPEALGADDHAGLVPDPETLAMVPPETEEAVWIELQGHPRHKGASSEA